MGLLQNLRKVLRVRTTADVELDYLNASTSPADLDLRIREIDIRRFRRYPRLG